MLGNTMANPSSVLDSVVKILGHIQTLTNNWCQACDAYADFPRKVSALRITLNAWKTGVDELGLSWDETLVTSLGEAEMLLQSEEKELQKRIAKEGSGHAWGFQAKLKMTVLPDRIGKSVNRIRTALDNILKAINDAREISAALEERALAWKPSLGFQRDKRYVRLQQTEELVRTALTQACDPKVVLLYGGAGRGKSCLARDVALQMERSVDVDSSQQSNLGASSSTDPNQVTKTFDKVMYIECGREAQSSAIQLDLLQKLGRGAPASDDKIVPVDLATQSKLKGLLKNQKILIIFDDVWNADIVKSIIDFCGKNVKCFLTTQIRDLCHPLNCSHLAIPMEKIDLTCARKILASHILGHEDGIHDDMYTIPEHLEGLADEIIQEVDANPLAMACVATGIDCQSFQDERVWQKVVEDLSDSLDSEDTVMIHNSKYPSSFWVAIQQSVERLTKQEKKLFIIVSLCRGPAVPEEVVEYLYKLVKVNGFSQFFLKAKRQLENRQLIQTRERFCSIHSLLQEFVVQKLQPDKSTIESQLEELFKSDSKKGILESDHKVDLDILNAIINLYFSQKTAFTMDGTIDTSSALNGSGYVLEPITRLLLSNRSGLPTTTLRSHLREVFLTYMKSGSIHEEAAITLLRSSNSKCIPAITNVLVRFAQAPNHSISVGDGVVCALLGLLRDENLYKTVYSMSQNDLLSKAISAVCWLDRFNRKHGKAFDLNDPILFTYFTSALEEIGSAMAMDDNRDLQQQAISALWDLSAIPNVQKHIATPRILVELSKILNKDGQAEDRKHAANIFANLSLGGEHVCQEMVSISTALQGLVSALTRDDNCGLQSAAAGALATLAGEGGEIIVLKISGIPESLEKLVHALTKTSNPELQKHAARALANLANGGSHNLSVQISNIPTALEELVRALEMDTNPDFQTQATRALANLSSKGGETIVLKIYGIPESLDKLVHALKESNPKLQKQAARVLATLAFEGNHDLCKRISNVQGSISDKTNALGRSGNVDGQFHLALRSAFSISSTCNSELQLKLAETPGLIERLVVLGNNNNFNSPILAASASAIRALTLIDPLRGQQIMLNSAHSYLQRGHGELLLGLYKESLKDLNEAWRIQPLDWHAIPSLLCDRRTVKARLDDFPGALADANSLIEISRIPFHLQERGVLKCMMDDLPGALKDLDEALNLEPNDYECLKHRGYVKFLLQDEIGGRADSEKALEIKPPHVDFKHYGRSCLGESSVKYMGYELR